MGIRPVSIGDRLHDVDSILLILPSPVGDFLMTTPVAQTLHARFPNARFDIAGDPRTISLMEHCRFVDRRIGRPKGSGWWKRLEVIRELRKKRYDLIFDLRTEFLSYLLRSRWRFSRPARSSTTMHEVKRHLQIVRRIGLEGGSFAPCMWLSEDNRSVAARQLDSLPGSRWIAISPGASWIGKRWPARRYRDLARRLADECEAIALLGNHTDEKNCGRIAEALKTPHVNLANSLSLLETAAALERMRLYIGNCSGLGHVAAAVRTPTLTLFGPTDPVRYRPWGPHARWITSPTGTMEGLTLEAVFEAVQAALADHNSSSKAA